jgi:hypothetical protein
MDHPLDLGTRAKRAGETKPFGIDWSAYLRTYWQPGQVYATNTYVRARTRTGFAFRATSAGESGPVEPAWPAAVGGAVPKDGSVAWIAEAPGSNAIDTINTSVWSEVGSSALTLSGPSANTEDTSVRIAGGTAGQTYRIRNEILTASGARYQAEFSLEVK